jgi:tetratricopeptide (TPR) repeat protein
LHPTASSFGQTPANALPPVAVILELRGEGVKTSRQPTVWDPAYANQALFDGNLVQTDERSQALLRFSDLETVRVPERATLVIRGQARQRRGFDLLKGLLYFFNRDKPNQFDVHTPQMSAIIRGTEFVLEVADNGTTTLSLLEGVVEMSNPFGPLELKSGEQGIAEPGKPLRKTALLHAVNVIQWCLYYPAVLDPEELHLSAGEGETWSKSLTAYRQGDLVAAFAAYPQDRQPASEKERVYLAALRLAFGQVAEAEQLLEAINPGSASVPLVRAVRTLIATVKGDTNAATLNSLSRGRGDRLSSVLLAESYWQQSLAKLPEALAAARKAAELSTNFSFAWARVGELEFSFGHTRAAGEAIEKSLELGPRNAQAHALRGFLLAAHNRVRDAHAAFEQAVAIDPMLGNAWLGRGLCRLKLGQTEAGRQDLQVAATVEPNRAVLRSYLGKAFSNAGDVTRAGQELELAKKLDANDPTGWLYAALFHQQQHTFNEAVRDLEHSQELNNNRRVYRSGLSLDQDAAVRSASLAAIYRDAGLTDVSVREAARAVNREYANYSAHLFLANSYDALRDPTRFNLRYETAWFNELLLANLLAPGNAGTFSPNISQQEYFRLFERDRLGLASTTELRSDKQYREVASQFGTFGRLSYSLDLDWQRNEGVRPNNELTRIEWYSQIKLQLTPQDSLLLFTKYQDYHSGDNFQYFDPAAGVRTNFNFDEFQKPIVLGAFHREWTPGMHTLLLGGRLINDQRLADTPVPLLVVATNSSNQTLARPSDFDVNYRSELEIYTFELNQIVEHSWNTAVFGARYQTGEFDTRSSQVSLGLPAFFTNINTVAVSDFHHAAAYAYDTVNVFEQFRLTAGVAYDELRFPRNYRQVPISPGEETESLLSPKAALVWNPRPEATVRGAYTRSLGGVNLDESYRLEPVQLAGFSQAFRTVIPESVAGSVSAPTFETAGAALDLKFKTRTYVGLQGERLKSDVDRSWGVYDFNQGAMASVIPQRLNFEERSVSLAVNQLVGQDWSFGAQYRFLRDELQTRWPSLDSSVNPGLNNDQASDLHRLSLYALFNHPSGFFARAEADWYLQDNLLQTNNAGGMQSTAHLPDDEFWQLNFWLGYRFRRGLGDLSVGLLNATGKDYKLNPLNPYTELPRERVVALRLRLRF